ncbi:uncharacterized protein KQ657_001006 [Scheffersomyces spartinae]|uniref:RING-type E3 ubiquitin transferase n=1 Tax=Scheffersomyces spartinae TaxID=45513 RepID=A0A9P8AI50_9ASCO|nr:uncharacterized protein KQ657_001006 [Scheffersomyces spartinae]KAG7193244.1 hypothetical protein KQ657_001006 [Scheffersomyces spartinae]
MEWLKHSKRTPARCDICNTEYQFQTIYDPSMPSRIPVSLVRAKIMSLIKNVALKVTSIVLAVTCILVEVPLFWTFTVRLLTWLIDGKLPDANGTFWEALKFGENNVDITLVDTMSGSSRLRKFYYEAAIVMYLGYFRGLGQILCCTLLVLVFYLQHQWVIRDDGFVMMLLRKVGKEPRSKLVDMIQQAISGLRNDAPNNGDARENLQRIESLVRVLNDLQAQQGANVTRDRQEALRRAIENGIPDTFGQAEPDDNETNAFFLRRDPITEDNDEYDGDNDEYDNDDDIDVVLGVQDLHEDNGSEAQDEIRANNDIHANDNGFAPPEPNHMVGHDPINEFDVGEGQNNNGDDPGAEDIGLDIFEFLGMGFNVKTPILVMVSLNLIFAVILSGVYLIPHILGNLVLSLARLWTVYLDPERLTIIPRFYTDDGYVIQTGYTVVDLTTFFVHEIFYKNLLVPYLDLFVHKYPTKLSWLQRGFVLSIGYVSIGLIIQMFMKSLVGGPKPIMGTPRTIYRVLFEFVATLKVLCVFSIEFFFSPAYCGWLLDFCFTPLFESNIVDVKQVDSVKVVKYNLFSTFQHVNPWTMLHLFVSSQDNSNVSWVSAIETSKSFSPFWRMFLYWFFGTVYAVILAVFVGMTRSQILRPGVLYFIRSPEDPNTRLIHSALVKPLKTQMFRVLYRGRVYTIFILIGIGSVVWNIQQWIMPTYFPMELGTSSSSILLPILAMTLYKVWSRNRVLLKEAHFQYWKYAFNVSCHKMRLSHFILGKPIPQERGTTVYRNVYYQFIEQPQPDYSNPMSMNQVQSAFAEDPQLKAVFVPNGNYMRVPDNDTTARKFIRKQFVAVTKDDRILYPEELEQIDAEERAKELRRQEEPDYLTTDSDGDGGILRPNHYTIVYQPPNFRNRWMGLIALLWVFALVLILSVLIVGFFLGNICCKILCELSYKGLGIAGKCLLSNKVNIVYALFGIVLEMYLFKEYDSYRRRTDMNNVGDNEVNVADVADAADEQDNDVEAGAGAGAALGILRSIGVIISSVWLLAIRLFWSIWVWVFCWNVPLKIILKRPFDYYFDFENDELSVPIIAMLWIFTLLSFAAGVFKLAHREDNTEFHSKYFRLWRHHFLNAIIDMAIALIVPVYTTGLFWTNNPQLHTASRSRFFILPVIVALQLSVRLIWILQLVWEMLCERVKNETYVQGRAIQNMNEEE